MRLAGDQGAGMRLGEMWRRGIFR